jgi:phage tail-like protein
LLNSALRWGDKPQKPGEPLNRSQGANVSVGRAIRLAAVPGGPKSFGSDDGSLGGLLPPKGMAVDEAGRLCLLDRQALQVKRFDPRLRRFAALPALGGEGGEARQFREPANIAVAGGDLYVADLGNRRVQVFALDTLALRQILGSQDADGLPVPPGADSAWQPADVAACGAEALILDRRHGAVYACENGRLRKIIALEAAKGEWSRLAVDAQRRVCVLDAVAPGGGGPATLHVFSLDGKRLGRHQDPGDVADAFPPPPIRLDAAGCFRLSQPGGADLLFDRAGEPVKPAPPSDDHDYPPAGQAAYCREGFWISAALDSAIYDCQWHRIELELADLPPGTRLAVSTYADNAFRSADYLQEARHLWEGCCVLVGQIQPSGPNASPAVAQDALVQSPPGRYLWLRLALVGDGYDTPALAAAVVHYPRESYLRHLPAIYSAEEESRRFLERFLAVFQAEWDALDGRLDEIARYFDPDAVPAKFLPYLAGWLALPFEDSWTDAQKRRLLSAAPSLYPHRGTPGGLRRYLRICLANLTGLAELAELAEEADGPPSFPLLVEGFRQRDYLILPPPGQPNPESESPPPMRTLWSLAVVGRLRLDVYATEGEARLVSTGDPAHDAFQTLAHRFDVYVPSAWIRSHADEEQLRRALDGEKPAHTAYRLCLVEPLFRVGVQSTVGIDTLIGDYPQAVLACADDSRLPPSRAPANRLGYDTVLAGGGCAPGRVGIDTFLL